MNNNEPPITREFISAEIKYQHYYQIDLGEMDCISEDDILQELVIVGKVVSDDIMDCFWEAEIADLCIAGNTWYTELRDYFSEIEYNNYSKYMCNKVDSGFYYCNKDSCEGCRYFGSKQVLNEQYVLWQKYVQPIELKYE